MGLTAYTNSAPRAYEIADAFRRRGVPVVMGESPGFYLAREPGSLFLYTKEIEVDLEG